MRPRHATLRAALLAGAIGAAVAACGRRNVPESASVPDAQVTPTSASTTTSAPRVVRIDAALIDEGRVRTVPVARRAPAGIATLPADIVASAEGAAEAGSLVAGRVARFEHREGDRVKRGEVLAWIDAPEAARAIADLVRSRARVETQTRKVGRLEGLMASEAATQVALDEARLELDVARADLAAARTVAANLGLTDPPPSSARLPVKSPVDGVVVERGVPLGGHVTPDTALFRIVSEGRVLVDARIADGAVPPAAGVLAHVKPRDGTRCAARVIGVLPQVDPSTRSRKVRLAPDPSCAGLVAGAQAEVEIAITSDGAEVLVVPSAALVELKGATIGFVAGSPKGTFEVRPVEPGARIGEDVVVASGLEEGDRVVVEGAVLLKGELMRSELGGE